MLRNVVNMFSAKYLKKCKILSTSKVCILATMYTYNYEMFTSAYYVFRWIQNIDITSLYALESYRIF